MRVGTTISVIAHVAVLLWSVISFAGKPFDTPPMESMPVDIISSQDFSQITNGSKKAKVDDKPKPPLVEKVADKKQVDDPNQKVVDNKPEIVATAESTPPPQTEPQPPQQQQQPPAAQPAMPAKTDTKIDVKKTTPKTDPIADAIQQDDASKKDEKKDQKQDQKQEPPKVAQAPAPPKPPIPVPPKFDPMKIAAQLEKAALLDKRQAQRQASAGDTLSRTPAFGVNNGTAQTLSQSELDALRARLAQLWNPPAGAKNPDDLVVVMRIQLTRQGTLAAPPAVVNTATTSNPLLMAARDSAARAIFRGQPYTMLRQETYDTWKDIEITFDPRQMLQGY